MGLIRNQLNETISKPYSFSRFLEASIRHRRVSEFRGWLDRLVPTKLLLEHRNALLRRLRSHGTWDEVIYTKLPSA